MGIPENDIKRITKLYNSVVQYYFSQNPREILNMAHCKMNVQS